MQWCCTHARSACNEPDQVTIVSLILNSLNLFQKLSSQMEQRLTLTGSIIMC